jgi:chromosome partitioning protein
MAKVIAVVSQKGGVGKTTTAANLGASLAREGQNVLLLECDPQGALMVALGIEEEKIQAGLLDVLQDKTAAKDAVVDSSFDGLSLLVSLAPGSTDELELDRCATAHPMHLREVVDALVPHYDTIIVDGPATLGPLTRMTLAAADSYLVPVQAEEYSYRTLPRLMQTIEEVQRDFNPDLECEGLLITMVDLRTRMSVRVVNQLFENYGDKVLMTMIPRTVTLQDMPVRGKPTVLYARASRGAKAYGEVASEILANQQPVAEIDLGEENEALAALAAADARDDLSSIPLTPSEPSVASDDPAGSDHADSNGGDGKDSSNPIPKPPVDDNLLAGIPAVATRMSFEDPMTSMPWHDSIDRDADRAPRETEHKRPDEDDLSIN